MSHNSTAKLSGPLLIHIALKTKRVDNVFRASGWMSLYPIPFHHTNSAIKEIIPQAVLTDGPNENEPPLLCFSFPQHATVDTPDHRGSM